MGGTRHFGWLLVLALALHAPPAHGFGWIVNWMRVKCQYGKLKPSLGDSGLSKRKIASILGDGPTRDQYRNARDYVLSMPSGTKRAAQARAETLNDLFTALAAGSDGKWSFEHKFAADGAHCFKAPDLPIALVVRPTDGAIFSGEPGYPRSSWYPPYDRLRRY